MRWDYSDFSNTSKRHASRRKDFLSYPRKRWLRLPRWFWPAALLALLWIAGATRALSQSSGESLTSSDSELANWNELYKAGQNIYEKQKNYLEALKTEISILKDGSRALTLLSEQLLTSNDNLRQFNEQIGSRMQERDEDLSAAYEDIEKLEKQKLRLIIAVVVMAAVIVGLGFFGFKFLARMFGS